jgi:hypothetical protein
MAIRLTIGVDLTYLFIRCHFVNSCRSQGGIVGFLIIVDVDDRRWRQSFQLAETMAAKNGLQRDVPTGPFDAKYPRQPIAEHDSYLMSFSQKFRIRGSLGNYF